MNRIARGPAGLLLWVAVLMLAVLSALSLSACGGGGGGGGATPADPPPATSTLYWLEPTGSTVIASGQTINIYVALKAQASDAYPAYVDAATVSWTSSNPAVATVSAGSVIGLAAGSTVITAAYNGHSSQVTVQVSGTWQNRTVLVSGQGVRRYSVYTPDLSGSSGPYPAIVSMHGGGGSAMIQAASTRLVELARAQKTYLVFLEGTGLIQTFNAGACCGSAQSNNVDDVAYAAKVLDDVAALPGVDATRVYASGFSNGGMMAHRLGCALAARLAGIAAVGGASAQYDQSASTAYYTCSPTRRIPVLHIHATNDRNYPYAGGLGNDGVSSVSFYPVQSSINDWIARNNVKSTPVTEHPTATTTCLRYAEPANTTLTSAPVTLCTVNPVDVYDAVNAIVFGGGHSWPGGVRSPSSSSDTPVTDFSANDYLWRFFTP